MVAAASDDDDGAAAGDIDLDKWVQPPVVAEPPVVSEAPATAGDMKFPPEIPCRGPCRSPAGDPRPGEPPFEHCSQIKGHLLHELAAKFGFYLQINGITAEMQIISKFICRYRYLHQLPYLPILSASKISVCNTLADSQERMEGREGKQISP